MSIAMAMVGGEQPDGSRLAAYGGPQTPDQRTRQRDELRRKDLNSIGIRVDFVTAKWPDNFKSARAGKLTAWTWLPRRVPHVRWH